MNIKKIGIVVCAFFVTLTLLVPNFLVAKAQSSAVDLLTSTGVSSGFSATTNEFSLSIYIGKIILIMLSLLGVIFLVLTIYAGFLWFTAGGDDKKVQKATEYLKNGVIGLIIILASVSITTFIISRLTTSGVLESSTTTPARP